MARNGRFSKLTRRGSMSLRDELELIGSQIAHLSERTVGEGQEKLAEEVEKLKGTFDDLLERATETTFNGIDTMTSKVQERPIESVLGAFAAGAVLAALFARR
jgi:ElaB/YqjD/DUF883 family membrane-anchored ribosome-binding protein